MPPQHLPEVQGVPVTPGNWEEPPVNRWTFWHVAEILPAYRVSRGCGPVRPLPDSPASADLLSIPVPRIGGTPGEASSGTEGDASSGTQGDARSGTESTVGGVLADTFTDAYVVLQDGKLVTEWYGPQGGPDRRHALMSISKSIVGCVAAILIDRGQLDAGAEITGYVPELAGSGYAGATVRNVLDMRTGVRFTEAYADPRSDIDRLGQCLGWSQQGGHESRQHENRGNQDEPAGLYRFLATLPAEAPHGGRFLYRSAESDVLGWVCERAAGQPMAALVSGLLWAPMGAEHDADLLHDYLGTAVHDGGLCATARDIARFGQLLLDGGTVPSRDAGTVPSRDASTGPSRDGGTRRVVPPRWLRQGWAVDADVRTAFAASPAEISFPGGWYRNQFWFRPGSYGDVLLGLGIYGQMLHVSRRTGTVCVKFSSWPRPQEPAFMEDTLRAFDAIGGALAGREPVGRRPRLAGVVSGLSRRGNTAPSVL
jgi:CubicO group peptidase (beta-lactamase class C family)